MAWFIFLIVCISLDSFVLMMEKGATSLRIEIKVAFAHSMIFALTDATLLLLGNVIGSFFYLDRLARLNQMITFVILILISANLFIKTYHKKTFVEKLDPDYGYHDSVKNALFTGIDCFLIGLIVSSLCIPYGFQWIICFLITLVLTFSAMFIGYRQGACYQKFIGYLCSASYLLLAVMEAVAILR